MNEEEIYKEAKLDMDYHKKAQMISLAKQIYINALNAADINQMQVLNYRSLIEDCKKAAIEFYEVMDDE